MSSMAKRTSLSESVVFWPAECQSWLARLPVGRHDLLDRLRSGELTGMFLEEICAGR